MTSSEIIRALADASRTPQHELLLECMDRYNVSCLRDLSTEQLQEFYNERRKYNGTYGCNQRRTEN